MIIKGEEYIYRIGKKEYHCAMDVTMAFIGGKWKTVVLWYLIGGKKRFGELKKRIPNITEKMLSIQLKALEEDGLVKRKVYPQVPPKVEYSLTKEGESMIPLLEAIAGWGKARAEKKGKMVKI